MIKYALALCALLCMPSAFAAMPDFSAFAENGTEHGGGDRMHECMKAGWQAAQPSEDQNKQAHEFMCEAHKTMEAHKDAIHQGVRDVMHAWMQHPIVKDDVITAESHLHDHIVPVSAAMRDARINILNLLSAEQRGQFDHAFHECIHHN